MFKHHQYLEVNQISKISSTKESTDFLKNKRLLVIDYSNCLSKYIYIYILSFFKENISGSKCRNIKTSWNFRVISIIGDMNYLILCYDKMTSKRNDKKKKKASGISPLGRFFKGPNLLMKKNLRNHTCYFATRFKSLLPPTVIYHNITP